jgi:hypothetical protein
MSLIDENAIFEQPQKMGGDGNGPSMPFFTLLNLAIKGGNITTDYVAVN